MANDWFAFKQFEIRQDRCAMKVGTDGVLLGAWAQCLHARRVLDVGTGTGLLALMLAQRFPGVVIDGIEIDSVAAQQAHENFKNSPWPDWLNIIQDDFLSWSLTSGEKYDMIVCNPPFFKESLTSPDQLRSTARHDHNLPLGKLIRIAPGLLSDNGSVGLILPVDRLPELAAATVQAGLHLNRIMRVRSTPEKQHHRVMVQLDKKPAPVVMEELTISMGEAGGYSDDYIRLTRDFYLEF